MAYLLTVSDHSTICKILRECTESCQVFTFPPICIWIWMRNNNIEFTSILLIKNIIKVEESERNKT